MPRRSSPSWLLLFSWLAIFIAGMISADLVVDLAFESPDLSETSDAAPLTEEPDNSAEHVMMPTHGFGSQVGLSSLQVIASIDPIPLNSVAPLSHASTRSCPGLGHCVSSQPPSFLLALRI
ncbi:MAG: hypothetical protein KIT40_16570 [Nitrospira sp.]|nr:hypothetical protein [Nitrospira sp.]